MRRPAVVLAAVLLGLGLAGCGVPVDGSPRAVDPPLGPFQALSSPSPAPQATDAGPIVETLFMVKGSTLVTVERPRATEPTIDDVVADLQAGPTDAEKTDGISSPLQGGVQITSVTVQDGIAVVEIGGDLESTARTDQKFAFGQIVCTLAAQGGIDSVTFTNNGVPVQVPKGDSTLSKDPLTQADYSVLR